MSIEDILQLMQTLDDAWNTQDWDVFSARHAEDVAVYWPGQTEPTRGRQAHLAEAKDFFKTFPGSTVGNRPYKVLFGQGEWTCSVANMIGTMQGPMRGADGTMIPPTGKSFEVEFCTVAHWVNGEIVEEKLFYNLLMMLKQLGLM